MQDYNQSFHGNLPEINSAVAFLAPCGEKGRSWGIEGGTL